MTLKTVRQAVNVLRALAVAPGSSVMGVAGRVGLTRSSTHRLLQTLEIEGLVTRGLSGYELGIDLIRLAKSAERSGSHARLLKAARLSLERLLAATEESVVLAIPAQGHTFLVDGLESQQAVRCAVGVGDLVAFNAGAGSKAILMHLPIDTRRRQVASAFKYTESSIVDFELLEEDLARARDRGWTFSDSEVTPGTRAVGAPVFDSTDSVVGSLVVTAPSERMPDAQVPFMGEVVKSEALALSEALGWRHHDGGDMSSVEVQQSRRKP